MLKWIIQCFYLDKDCVWMYYSRLSFYFEFSAKYTTYRITRYPHFLDIITCNERFAILAKNTILMAATANRHRENAMLYRKYTLFDRVIRQKLVRLAFVMSLQIWVWLQNQAWLLIELTKPHSASIQSLSAKTNFGFLLWVTNMTITYEYRKRYT